MTASTGWFAKFFKKKKRIERDRRFVSSPNSYFPGTVNVFWDRFEEGYRFLEGMVEELEVEAKRLETLVDSLHEALPESGTLEAIEIDMRRRRGEENPVTTIAGSKKKIKEIAMVVENIIKEGKIPTSSEFHEPIVWLGKYTLPYQTRSPSKYANEAALEHEVDVLKSCGVLVNQQQEDRAIYFYFFDEKYYLVEKGRIITDVKKFTDEEVEAIIDHGSKSVKK